MALVLGLDSSTQSVKAEVRDAATGRLMATGRARHPDTTPPRSEQDPASWWAALVKAVHDAGEHADLREVDAVSVAGQQHGMVVMDAADEVIRAAKLWNDTESSGEAAALVQQIGAPEWARRCGSVPVAAFTITKLAWLKASEPNSYARIASVLLPHDWLTFRLTGERTTDRGDASGTGYWSPAANAWRPDLLALVDADRAWAPILPEVRDPWVAAGVLGADAAATLGLRAGIRVGPGTGDNMAAALGLGLVPGDVAVSLGTSGTVYAVSDVPTADATGSVAGFADASGHFLPLVCTLNATKVFDAIARLLGVDLAEFDRLASTAPLGADGVVLVPYFDGERTPNRPEATGLISGLRSTVDRQSLARAAVEGVACGLLDGYDAIVEATKRGGAPASSGRVLLLGGGARSLTARQVFADLTGRAVTLPSGDEHVARGACVQAASVLVGGPVRWADDGDPVSVLPTASRAAVAAVRSAYAQARG